MSKRSFLLYEHFNDPLLPYAQWVRRVYHSVWLAVYIVVIALAIGIAGYHFLGHLNGIDSLLEASMILGGMGPVAPMNSDGVKIFASFYALASGFLILTTSGIILAPWLHRLLHIAHRKHHAEESAARKKRQD